MNGNDEIYRGQRVLITGGYGFVGAHLAMRLLETGAEVWALDRSTDRQRPSLVNCPEHGIRDRIYTVTGDVADTPQMTALLQQTQFDYIFHCAASAAGVGSANEKPGAIIYTNTMGTAGLLEAIRTSGTTPRGILHASTDKVYSDIDPSENRSELRQMPSLEVDDASKLAADVLACTYHKAFGLPVTILRMCDLIGPYDFNTDHRLVPGSLDAIFRGTPPELFLDTLEQHREYLHIDDAVEILLELTGRPSSIGETFDLVGCAHLSFREVMEQIVSAAALVAAPHDLNEAAEIRRRGYTVIDREADARQVTSLQQQSLDAGKLYAAISYRSRTSFGDGLFRCAEFHHRMAGNLSIRPTTEAHHLRGEGLQRDDNRRRASTGATLDKQV